MNIILGVSGGSGCGKSAFCDGLKAMGAFVLDADAIARKVTAIGMPALVEIAEVFGKEFLTEDGALDRKKMADCVFSDERKRRQLNEITHRYIIAQIKESLTKHPTGLRVIDAPLLFESGLDALCDRTVCILAEKKVRIARICARDGLSEEEAKQRIDAQPEDAFYTARADDVFYNNAGADVLMLAQKYWMVLEKKL